MKRQCLIYFVNINCAQNVQAFETAAIASSLGAKHIALNLCPRAKSVEFSLQFLKTTIDGAPGSDQDQSNYLFLVVCVPIKLDECES